MGRQDRAARGRDPGGRTTLKRHGSEWPGRGPGRRAASPVPSMGRFPGPLPAIASFACLLSLRGVKWAMPRARRPRAACGADPCRE
eukprot:7486346-Pyramimonas_sp.AAC.1